MDKSADAFRTISEVADELDLPQHVLRFWETRFPQIKPLKRAGGRRFYRPHDIEMLRGIRRLLYGEGYTIKGVQRILKEHGARALAAPGFTASANDLNFAPYAAQDLPPAQLETQWDSDLIAQPPDAAASSAGPLFETPRAAARAQDVDKNHPFQDIAGSPRPTTLSREDLGRLKAALADLEECEFILDTLRRP
jgi:DNA-binding transcriptional MerR regulator